MENNRNTGGTVRKGSRKSDPFMSKIRITHLYIVFVVITLIIGGLIIIGAYYSRESIHDMQTFSIEYAEGKDAIDDLMDASDFLTEQARLFVVTGDPARGAAYQNEVRVTKRREKALQKIKSFDASDVLYDSLESALKESNDLMETEYYAMHLAAEGFGLRETEYEEFTGRSVLSRRDEGLSSEQKQKKAADMMFDDAYNTKKNRIIDNVSMSLQHLDEELEARELESYNRTTRISEAEHFMFILILLASLFMFWLTAVMIINPIRLSSSYIMRNEPLPTNGSAEYFTLAEAYNRMLRTVKSNHEKLSYDATHDELTGLYNRKVFEEKRQELENSSTAMIIIDVDRFKEVNDNYGHEVGDRVLKKVGAILLSCFRQEDYVCRIGGDEFAVIMVDMDPSLKHVVENKIESVRAKLKLVPPDDLPPTTLSIGAAFSSDKGLEDNLFKKADKALYYVKEKSRNDYRFYSDINNDKE